VRLTPQPQHHDDHFLFFAPALDSNTIVLDQTESRHVHSVLRRNENDLLLLTDGKGCLARGVIVQSSASATSVTIISREYPKHITGAVTLIIGLPERDAFESIITDATAIGITRIIPLIAEYSQKPWWSYNWDKSLPRFYQKMVTALKQSKNVQLPHLDAPCRLKSIPVLQSSCLLIADTDGKPVFDVLSMISPSAIITAAVGPPGGFSPEETAFFHEQTFQKVNISPYRLRTELATSVFCAQIFAALGRTVRSV